MKVKCHFCPYEVETNDKGIWRLATGWCQQRKSGGSNAIKMREDQDRWAHNACVEIEAKSGNLSAMQESLL